MLLTDCTVKMPNIALFVMYPALIVRLSLPNLTRLKNHKKCIWQFKKHNQGKKKKKSKCLIRWSIWFTYPGMCNVLPACAEGHLHMPAPQGTAQEPSNCPVPKSHISGDQWDPPCLHIGLLCWAFSSLSAQYLMGFVALGCWKTAEGSENFSSLPHEIHSKNFID